MATLFNVSGFAPPVYDPSSALLGARERERESVWDPRSLSFSLVVFIAVTQYRNFDRTVNRFVG